MIRITLAVGFAAGYVLGARAGTERYGQIRRSTSALLKRAAASRGGSGATPAAVDPVVRGGAAARPAGSVGTPSNTVGPATAGVAAPSGAGPGQPPEKSIEEMSELQVELATAPLLPAVAPAGLEPAAAADTEPPPPRGRAGR